MWVCSTFRVELTFLPFGVDVVIRVGGCGGPEQEVRDGGFGLTYRPESGPILLSVQPPSTRGLTPTVSWCPDHRPTETASRWSGHQLTVSCYRPPVRLIALDSVTHTCPGPRVHREDQEDELVEDRDRPGGRVSGGQRPTRRTMSMSGEKKEQNGAMLSVEDPMKQQQHDGPSPSAAL
ncbi:unnamed protein product [Gadus morhua 'NCC']